MKIIKCRINHKKNPRGYKLREICASWQVTGAVGKTQRWARIRVAEQEDMSCPCYDSGERVELDSLGAPIPIRQKPRARYYWTVTVCTDAGETATSQVNWFETGKLDEAWSAQWIGCDDTVSRHPIFIKNLEGMEDIVSARLYVSGLGLFEAYIDGKKIGNEFLAPYCNHYGQWVQYGTYDVTEEIRGAKTLSVLLGNGWYKERFGFNSHAQTEPGGYYGNSWKLIAELHIDCRDGSHKVIGTDESWTVRRSNITSSSIYDGEHRDDTLAELSTEPALLCEPPEGRLTERLSTPVTVHEELAPIRLIHTPKDEWVYDIGQNIAGIFRMQVHEPRGTRILLQFGEVLQDGCFYRENLRSAKAEYEYISGGEETELIPAFTYYGYRYVKVSGVSRVRAEDLTALALYSELEQTGDFQCGHALVNQLVKNTRWGLKGNFVDVPTDCPQRDERMGWTGDAQVFSATACYLEDSYSFYEKYLYDMAREQAGLAGKVPDVVPSFGYTTCSSVWGDAACIIPWNLYLFYGDKSILEQQLPSMKGWVDYITGLEKEKRGAWGEHFHYGDWLALDHPSQKEDTVLGGTEEAYIAYLYYANSADIVARAAAVLGEEEAAGEYRRLSEQIFNYVEREYMTSAGRCAVPTQTGLLLALKYHLGTDGEKLARLLRKLFSDCGDKLKTGFTGTPILCKVLSDHGMDELAFHLLLNEDYPGWLHEIKLGATTIWERWNSLNDDGSISSTGMNSLNHYSYGSIVEWLFGYVAGIAPDASCPGFRRARIAPRFHRALDHVRAEYDSAAGRYEVDWRILDVNHVEIRLAVPFGAQADLVLPAGHVESGNAGLPGLSGEPGSCRVMSGEPGSYRVMAGEYRFVYRTDQRLWKRLSAETPLGDLLANEEAARQIDETLDGGAKRLPAFSYRKPLRQVLYDYIDKETADRLLEEIDERLQKISE